MLKKLVNNISSISANGLAYDVFKQKGVQTFIIDLNKHQLFVNGEQFNGSGLVSTNSTVGEYSLFTELLNQNKTFTWNGISKQKIAGDPYFLYDEGGFFNSFKLVIDKTGFKILAKGKIDMESEYGEILGLTNESKIKLVKEITPFFIEQLRKEMFK